MKNKKILIGLMVASLYGCSDNQSDSTKSESTKSESTKSETNESEKQNGSVESKPELTNKPGQAQHQNQQTNDKKVIYQVFTRLFGNRNLTNKQWGTKAENGVGKFSDFTPAALNAIKQYGATHVWYTGVPHHALVADYSEYGISIDDPDVIKGRAGSPYAVKDYYNVNPDLANEPANRLNEFKALIERTHSAGMKVIIDIVPNHVARNYQSISKPDGVQDFGQSDDTSVEYKRQNDFYYVVGEKFLVPKWLDNYEPIGGEKHAQIDGEFEEFPAKWTGNGARKAQPHFHDWYETVKVNYGVRPDGSHDFDKLPEEYRNKSYKEHHQFWSDKDVPGSWVKFRDIVLYWTEFGVDGFRYDMAEMVPVEFWSYLNSSIKMRNQDAFLLAEVYNPKIYRDYLQLGLMDSLYDKVDFYDTLKLIMQGKAPASKLTPIVNTYADIDEGMLHFLENHDEQRIASPDFAGDALKGMPAMVVSSLIGKGATLLYFAQALGEAGEGDAGFGDPTRTTIFDYWGLAKLKRWDSNGTYDGSQLLPKEKQLQSFYQKLLSFTTKSKALDGEYADLHQFNLQSTDNYDETIYSFARWSSSERVIVLSNFSTQSKQDILLKVPGSIVSQWGLSGNEKAKNIFDNKEFDIGDAGEKDSVTRDSVNKDSVSKDSAIKDLVIKLSLNGLESKVLVF